MPHHHGYHVVQDIKKAQSLGFGLDPEIELVKADVTAGADSLIPAIGDAQAVIVATGYTGFNPGGFGQVDEVVSMPANMHVLYMRESYACTILR